MLIRFTARLVLVCLALAFSAATQEEKVDLEMISKIRYEGFRDSKIMEIASGLMDGIGQRLTGSPNVKRANEWTRDKLTEFGLVKAQVTRVEIHLTPNEMARDMTKYKGKLAGKIVLYGDDPDIKLPMDPLARRLDEKTLSQINQYTIPSERNEQQIREFQRRGRLLRTLARFFADEKVVAVVEHSRGTIGAGAVFVDGGSYKVGQPVNVPWIIVAAEHWTRIARLLKQKKEVQLELNVKNIFYDDAMTQYNTIAEIPGTDKKDEVVMLGAHLDSWWSGTGATDNGAGSVVMMEAVRILKALNIKPRRTIRIGLWTGEEQGLLGSQWYVAQHFGSRPPSTDPDRAGDPSVTRRENGAMTLKPAEQSKVSVYFNVDNG